jgi:hypothetical protein
MSVLLKVRSAGRLIVGCAFATAVSGGLTLAASPASSIRLVGVSTQTTGKIAAVLIESTEPVAYAVSRPDPLTVLVALRNVSVADAVSQMAQAAKKGPVTSVSLEQATGPDGKDLARVRIALAAPSIYRVRNSRNVIRLELEAEAQTPLDVRAADSVSGPAPQVARAVTASDTPPAASATLLQKVRATHTRTSTTVTLAGNGRLIPSSLTESDDQPRRPVLDFPNVSPKAAARTAVDGAFVKQVRVALDSREPLVTRVVMDISPSATYHVERTGPDGRDLAVVFEGGKATGTIMVAPPSVSAPSAAKTEDETISLTEAIANGASIAPPDPIVAMSILPAKPVTGRPAAPQARAAASTRQTAPQPGDAAAAPASAGDLQPRRARHGPKQFTGHPINFDFRTPTCAVSACSRENGLNMIIDPQVQGRVNVLLNDVPWDQALDQIPALQQAGLHRRRQHPAHRAAVGARRRTVRAEEAHRLEGARR